MTAVPDATVEQVVDHQSADQRASEPPATAPPTGGRSRHHIGSVAGVVRWTVALGCAVLIYAAFLAVNGADPVEALRAMWDAAFGDSTGFGETLIRTAPLLLGTLAVVVPALLFHIGGQGHCCGSRRPAPDAAPIPCRCRASRRSAPPRCRRPSQRCRCARSASRRSEPGARSGRCRPSTRRSCRD